MLGKLQKTRVTLLNTEHGLQTASHAGVWERATYLSPANLDVIGTQVMLPGSGHWQEVVIYRFTTGLV